ncbi:hypothetical protein AGABI1DRAFT_79588 [Agaricus bisporus var. burnettii JB137-S8]|uniref:Uncharacterized protein n=2 Tax=Agaricus bisporus TaxID=5341 RepID=K5WK45_AGABU|nr:uncharacterized protein AGABI1DRAFT_79588 [Agaricus bisporus var. burnettii JB137-S8]EKM75641.1 hypothetical protein AGABI1DRAFT_79588 [Agaricus bisporus var. burnettii JB137-S8]
MLPRLIIWPLFFFVTLATAALNTTLVCTPFGACEPCPEEALHKPYCQPFGNRRLLQCKNSTDLHDRPHYAQHPPSLADSDSIPSVEEGAILAWKSCGRVVSTERADFFEFVAVNLLFLGVGVGIVIWRLRRMRLLHARQLAARIGLVGRRR